MSCTEAWWRKRWLSCLRLLHLEVVGWLKNNQNRHQICTLPTNSQLILSFLTPYARKLSRITQYLKPRRCQLFQLLLRGSVSCATWNQS